MAEYLVSVLIGRGQGAGRRGQGADDGFAGARASARGHAAGRTTTCALPPVACALILSYPSLQLPALDLLFQFQDPVHQPLGRRGAARNPDVDRDDLVDALD